MQRLSDRTHNAPYHRSMPPGVVHFGPGAFHRAHQAYFFDRLLAQEDRWGVCAVSLRSPAVRDALGPQDGLYTLVELGAVPRLRIIGAIVELLVAPEDPAAVVARLAAATTHSVTVTVTEKGYASDAPGSMVGFLVAGLRARKAFGLPGLAILSCDNLSENGRKLARAVGALAEREDAALAQWIAHECHFPDTMVDSITPATDDALRDLVARKTGVIDAWPVQREAFVQWVVGDDLPAMQRAALESVGVVVTAEVAGYEQVKLRLLNAAHSALAYAGLRAGHATVTEAMRDATIAADVETLMRDEIAPLLSAPAGLDVSGYVDAVLARFRNPAIHHRLMQIAMDGSQKLPVRIVPSIAAARAAGGPHARLLRAVAAWMTYVIAQASRGLSDPLADELSAIAARCTGVPSHDVPLFLALDQVFAVSWRNDAALIDDLTTAMNALDREER